MRLRPSVSAMALLAMVVAACSGNGATSNAEDDSPPPATEASVTGSPAVAAEDAEPIKIMNISEYSRTAAPVPEILDGVKAAAQAINEAGGIDGRPIEVLGCDTELDPNKASSCGREAVDEGVVAIVGHYGLSGGSFLPIAEENGIPVIGGGPVAGEDLTSEAFFPLAGGAPVNLVGLPGLLSESGADTISFGTLDFEGGASFIEFVEQGANAHGVDLTNTVAIPGNTPDMAPFAASALEGEVGGVAITLGASDFIKFVQAVRQAGSEVPIAVHGISATSPDTLASLGEQADGLLTPLPCLPLTSDNPDVQRWKDEMEAFAPNIVESLSSQLGWESAYLFKAAAEEADEITPSGLTAAMQDLHYEGLICADEVDYSQPASGLGDATRIFNTRVVNASAVDGEWVATTGDWFDVLEPGQ